MTFREEQRIDATWIKVLIAISTFTTCLIVLAVGLTSEDAVERRELFYVFPILLCVMGLMWFFIFRTTLITEADIMGFHFRYFPYTTRRRSISPEEIKSWSMQRLKTSMQYGGYGVRIQPMKKVKAYVMGSLDVLEIKLISGQTRVFTTRDPQGLQSTMRRYFAEKEVH